MRSSEFLSETGKHSISAIHSIFYELIRMIGVSYATSSAIGSFLFKERMPNLFDYGEYIDNGSVGVIYIIGKMFTSVFCKYDKIHIIRSLK